MDEKIKPALTPEEWAEIQSSEARRELLLSAAGDGALSGVPDERGEFRSAIESHHAAAALALYGRPFGFTHEDVEEIRGWSEQIEIAQEYGGFGGDVSQLRSLADRIEALLPPKSQPARSISGDTPK